MEDEEKIPTALPALDEDNTKRDFARAEWEQCRSQVHLLLSAIWRFEVVTISGFAIFYSWFLGAVQQSNNFDPLYLLIASCIFSYLALRRLKVEYAILIVLAQYSNELEQYLYNKQGASEPVGWEAYLAKNVPDEIKFCTVFKRYRNTGAVFTIILSLNAFSLVYFSWDRISIWVNTAKDFIS